MEAYIVEEPGGNFRKTDLPHPNLRPNHVLVRIKASGVNPLDTKIRAGKASHAKQSLPAVLGVDMAGIVEEIGPGVTAFSRGDEVYGMVGGVGGLQGTLAEFIGVDTDLLAHKPKNLRCGRRPPFRWWRSQPGRPWSIVPKSALVRQCLFTLARAALVTLRSS